MRIRACSTSCTATSASSSSGGEFATQDRGRLFPRARSGLGMMKHLGVVVVERVVGAAVQMELGVRAAVEREFDRLTLLGTDVRVRIAELEEHRTANVLRHVERVGDGGTVVADRNVWVRVGGDEVRDPTTEAETDDAGAAVADFGKRPKVRECR